MQYAVVRQDQPRPMVIHAVRIDTWTEGIEFHVTPRRAAWREGEAETDRQTTRDFLRSLRAAGVPLVVSVNGDAFSPWPAPYRESTPTDLRGLAIADGQLVSGPANTPSLLIYRAAASREADRGLYSLAIQTTTAESDLRACVAAISGFALCLRDGEPIGNQDDVHPRTGFGLSADQRWLFLVAIDGRQPLSHGATVGELGAWLRRVGAWHGINMDGGGSTTLAWWNEALSEGRAAQLLNQPVGSGGNFARVPPTLFFPTERANGNNFGVSLRDE